MTRVKMQKVLGELYSESNVKLYLQWWTLDEIRVGREYHEAWFASDFLEIMGKRCSRDVPGNCNNFEIRYSQTRLDI